MEYQTLETESVYGVRDMSLDSAKANERIKDLEMEINDLLQELHILLLEI